MLTELEDRAAGAWLREYYALPLCKEEERIRLADRAARLEMMLCRGKLFPVRKHQRQTMREPGEVLAAAKQAACDAFGIASGQLEAMTHPLGMPWEEWIRLNEAKQWYTLAIYSAFGMRTTRSLLGVNKNCIYDRAKALKKTCPEQFLAAQAFGSSLQALPAAQPCTAQQEET